MLGKVGNIIIGWSTRLQKVLNILISKKKKVCIMEKLSLKGDNTHEFLGNSRKLIKAGYTLFFYFI